MARSVRNAVAIDWAPEGGGAILEKKEIPLLRKIYDTLDTDGEEVVELDEGDLIIFRGDLGHGDHH